MERKINAFIKRNQIKMTYASLPFVFFGFLGHRLYLHLADGFILHQMCLAAFLFVSLLCGLPIVFRAFLSLRYRIISIELLVTLAVLGAMLIGELEECALVTFLFQFGNDLELRTMKKTKSAIK